MKPLESHVLFAGNDADGTFEVGTIDQSDGTYVPTHKGTGFGPGWTHVVAVGPHVLSVRNHDRQFEVGHIDQSTGQYTPTETSTFSTDWTHVVAVGPYVLFVAQNGQYEVGHIDEFFTNYVSTQKDTVFTDSNHVVAACSRVFLSRDDQFVVGHIDQSTVQFVKTQDPGPGVGGTPDPIHVLAVGPHVLGVSPTTALGFVMHFNHTGQFVETQTGPPFASDWAHVVAVV